jgi:hypothetical protein
MAFLPVEDRPARLIQAKLSGVVYKKVRSRNWPSIDVGLKPKLDHPAVEALLSIVRGQFSGAIL